MIIQSTFKPAWWLKNPHLQTIYPTLCRRVSPVPPLQIESLITEDQDVLEIVHCGNKSAPIILLLHGLAGNSQSIYIQGLQAALYQNGLRSMSLNFRGCYSPNRTALCYHLGEINDIHFLYQQLRQREPNTPIAAIGFSLGGSVLLNWLSQCNSVELFAAIAISVPYQLAICSTQLDQGFAKLYRWYLLSELKKYMRNKQRYLKSIQAEKELTILKQLGDLNKVYSFWDYDNRVAAKLYHFVDVHDYYQQCSSRFKLKSIQIPTLLIQALDDPFMNSAVIPRAEELSSSTVLEYSEFGGHVGFVSGDLPTQPHYWLESRILTFLQQHLPNP